MQNKKMLPLTDRRALVVYLQEMRYRRIAFQNLRYAYNMDGIDDRFVLANRAINPDGDNSFEFWTPNNFNAVIISQNISTTATSREFQLYVGATPTLLLIFGGVTTQLLSESEGAQTGAKYFLSLTGTSFSISKGSLDNIIKTGSFSKGAAREPAAPTVIGARQAGPGVFVSYSLGIQRDIKINGTLWPMADRNQSIQPSIPAGNNMIGVNLNPDRWVEIAK